VLETEDDIALLKRIEQRDEEAFKTLYKRMSRRVYAFALNRTRDEARAEEVLVDTMHEVWRKPMQFNGTSKLSTWILGIARYKILNSFREDKHGHEVLTDELAEGVESGDLTPFEVLAEQQRSAAIRGCMAKLPEEQRECLHLAFFEDMSLAEIASLQECPENTVKTRLFHARRKIKNCLRLVLESEGTPVAMREK
jgi:RNA polymerase sigma-70 factor, ECF subfamily